MKGIPANGSATSHGYPRCAQSFLAIALAILTLALSVQDAGARSVGWCRSDPVVMIDGNLADIFVSIPARSIPAVSGATEFVITTPEGVDVDLVVYGVGYGYGEAVTVVQSPSLTVTDAGIELQIEVYLPAKRDIPVLVEFAPRAVGVLAPTTAEGTANQWISVHTVF